MSPARVSPNGCTITVSVPLRIRKRGGRKVVISPDSAPTLPARGPEHSAVVKALARAWRWQRMLDAGVYATVAEIAAAERINPSYVSRVLRLTLLTPALVEAILDGRQGPEVMLDRLLQPLPIEWERQPR